jgi:hypothetical protein
VSFFVLCDFWALSPTGSPAAFLGANFQNAVAQHVAIDWDSAKLRWIKDQV